MTRSRLKPSPMKRKKPLNKVSAKRAKENREYARLRKEFLEEHPFCRVCLSNVGLGRLNQPFAHPSTQVHHKARRGKFLLRTDTWLAVCDFHHDYIEKNGNWARANGWLLTPEQRRKLDA